jgi:hypothetical protein
MGKAIETLIEVLKSSEGSKYISFETRGFNN